MLTTTGWSVAIGSLSLVVVGRLLGIPELFYVGAGGVALVVACVLRVSLVRLNLDIGRELQPSRVHAGTPSRVELRVRNRAGTRTPVMTLRDPVGKGRTARVVLAPLGGSDTVRAAYRLPTERRGLLKVGPMTIEVTDPFGIATATSRGAGVGELTVWPAVDDVEPLPHTIGDDPMAGADTSNVSSQGDEFYALRPYVLGDDLRRVHWRSSARGDDLMVRQDEMPWQGRATVLLDSRRGAHSAESFERAVSAAASVVLACARRRFLVRLVTTVGDDSQFGAGGTHVEQILERLATIELTDEGRLDHVLTLLRRPGGGGGALVAMLGGRAHPDAAAVQRLRHSHPSITIVRFIVARLDRDQQLPGELLVDDDAPFAEVWDQARRSARVRRAGVLRR